MNRTAKKLLEAIAPGLIYAYLRLLRWTVRGEIRNGSVVEEVHRTDGQCIFAFWHSRLVLVRFAYSGERLVVLQSRHRDSRMIGRVMRRFGVEQAWGSSSRGGAAALREVLRKIREGFDMAIAPDGPRGPRRRVAPGVIAAARLSGKPIVPLTYSARPARRARSWDRMVIPWPFARVLYEYGAPIHVRRSADEQEQERLRQQLERELDRMTDALDSEIGLGQEDPRPPIES
jgi:lysophospholipid acyltransferase (LPLAT)-like uncharacterized protein